MSSTSTATSVEILSIRLSRLRRGERESGFLALRVCVPISGVVMGEIESDSTIASISTLKRLIIRCRVQTNTLLKLASNCPNLEELYINDVHGRNIDNAVSALAENCRQLHTLHIRSESLTDAGLSAVAQYCSQLHTLHLRNAIFDRITDQTRCCNDLRTCLCGGRGERIHIDSPCCYSLCLRGTFPCCFVPSCCPSFLFPCAWQYDVFIEDATQGLYEITRARNAALQSEMYKDPVPNVDGNIAMNNV